MKLKPCPFCGSNGKLKSYTGRKKNHWEDAPVSYWVICNKFPKNQIATGCMGGNPTTEHHKSEEEAIKAWNQRVKESDE